VRTVAQRLENVIAERDAEIARLREHVQAKDRFPGSPRPENDAVEVPQAAQPPPDIPDANVTPAPPPDPETTTPDPETTTSDDLKRIEGIGPRISTALNEAGIDTYHALAQADEEDLRGALREAGLAFAPSLVTWSRQAALLAGGDEDAFQEFTSDMVRRRPRRPPSSAPERDQEEPASAIAPDSTPETADEAAEDDLERVEGIGPRISKALRAAGIRSYRQLADSDVPALKTALEEAGLRFTPSLPTWPRQAAFLADDDEDGFEAFTTTLVGGRDTGRKA
jgi:predicted flap endonuclease-1-like 5' DNA nuclease